MENPILIGPITQLLTLDYLPLKGALQDGQMEILEASSMLIRNGTILEIAGFEYLKHKHRDPSLQIIELTGDYVALPGFVDCHTHICFGGSRAKDFTMRNSGKTYLEIAQAGGGIWDTVTETRKLQLDELAARTVRNADRHFREGVTTIEVKSGYGLSIAEELKMLRAIQAANQKSRSTLIPTCLAAHMKPKDFPGSPTEYLAQLSEELLPTLKRENLTHRIDAFVEKSAFSAGEIDPYFGKASSMGFDLTVHADQFSTGGSEVAVRFKAKSADHLEASSDHEIDLLAKSDVISVALPGASLGLGCGFAPARRILDAGGALAIASDWNPGSAPMGDLLAQASILAAFEKLSSAEVLAGITCRAAAALGLEDRGKLKAGLLADFCLFPVADFQEILYHQGKLQPAQVWKNGKAHFICL